MITTVIEFGAGNGTNLQAVRTRWPGATIAATDINVQAVVELRARTDLVDVVYEGSLLGTSVPDSYDLVLAVGVLTCLAEESLPTAYERLWRACRGYLLVFDYYSPSVTALAHGPTTLLMGDFAEEIVRRYEDLHLVGTSGDTGKEPDLRWTLLSRH